MKAHRHWGTLRNNGFLVLLFKRFGRLILKKHGGGRCSLIARPVWQGIAVTVIVIYDIINEQLVNILGWSVFVFPGCFLPDHLSNGHPFNKC